MSTGGSLAPLSAHVLDVEAVIFAAFAARVARAEALASLSLRATTPDEAAALSAAVISCAEKIIGAGVANSAVFVPAGVDRTEALLVVSACPFTQVHRKRVLAHLQQHTVFKGRTLSELVTVTAASTHYAQRSAAEYAHCQHFLCAH